VHSPTRIPSPPGGRGQGEGEDCVNLHLAYSLGSEHVLAQCSPAGGKDPAPYPRPQGVGGFSPQLLLKSTNAFADNRLRAPASEGDAPVPLTLALSLQGRENSAH
jgi:hypothetical protein